MTQKQVAAIFFLNKAEAYANEKTPKGNPKNDDLIKSIDDKHIIFPERIIKMVFANAEQLKLLIAACPFIAEIRRVQEATTFFEDLTNREQKEWIDELLQRINYTDGNVTVCLLDTGVTAAHPLLEHAINSDHIQAANTAWGNGDHQGHGTEMAGITLFNNLKAALTGNDKIEMPQKIESVKILPPTGGNDPDLYGCNYGAGGVVG